MAAYDRRAQPFIIVAALAPFVIAMIVDSTRENLFTFVDLASWAVFVIDYVVRNVIQRRYWRSGAGTFDLAIVLLTFPWYILPFGANATFMSVFRIARVIRVFTATSAASRMGAVLQRLGGLGITLLVVSIFSALVVMNAEPPESGFETFGDALWWATVSFTTVGYGDLFPVTALGRFAGLLMMLAGLAALGTVSAVLSESFRGNDQDSQDANFAALLEEVRALRTEVADLRDRQAGPPDNR